MAVQKERLAAAVDPDRTKLTPLQAERLSAMSDIAAKSLEGLTVADISEKFRFQIDPMLLASARLGG